MLKRDKFLTSYFRSNGLNTIERIKEVPRALYNRADADDVHNNGSMAQLLDHAISLILGQTHVTCRRLITEELWRSKVDDREFILIINCLVTNAIEALREKDYRNLEIVAENVVVDARHQSSLQRGPYIKIVIKDNAHGIPHDNAEKIFEPYFTTKPDGVGLGLPMARAIVEKNQGGISIESEINLGCSVTVYLPAHQEEEEGEPIGVHFKKPVSRRGKILVVDSEALIRKFIGTTISKLGYRVELSSNCFQALRLYEKAKESDSDFDLLMVDLTKPHELGALDVVVELLAIDPKIKAIVSSGYYNDPVITNYRQYGFEGALVKPYNVEEIYNILCKILNGKLL